jgi:hypothetical protein
MMINQAATPGNPLKGKELLMALILGLLFYVWLLADQGTLPLLSPERRIVLVIFAIRLPSMVRPSLTDVEQANAAAKPSFVGWRAGILPLAFITPPFVVLWLAWLSSGKLVPDIPEIGTRRNNSECPSTSTRKSKISGRFSVLRGVWLCLCPGAGGVNGYFP